MYIGSYVVNLPYLPQTERVVQVFESWMGRWQASTRELAEPSYWARSHCV